MHPQVVAQLGKDMGVCGLREFGSPMQLKKREKILPASTVQRTTKMVAHSSLYEIYVKIKSNGDSWK